MSLYNIVSSTSYNIPKATWNTGNSRENLVVKPNPGPENYVCLFSISITGSPIPLNKCRYETEAEHGAQPGSDLFIFL